ncbi:MAG TPA: hypothetical protein VF657_20820 [Actinoplanes sp.]|jgi:hypothetical protein
MKKKLVQASVAFGLTVGLMAPFATTALAAVVAPATPRTGSLTQVGPIADHGFPAWYRDSNGVRLEACTTLDDPLCSTLPDEVPNPDEPVSYPDNFPGEFFYQLAGAEVTMTNGVTAGIGLDLEGAWAAEEVVEGDQMVFGRVRIRFDAAQGEKYRITHPYGIDELVADNRGVNMTEDIGITPGAFGEAMKSRIGPFLVWDPAVAPAAPAGYVGDPGVDHKVVGSPYNTNFIRIERIDPATGAVQQQMGFTDLFSIQGRYATNAGVNLDQATYSLDPYGNGVIEVFATSEPDQVIEIVGNPALGYHNTRLRGQAGRYYGRFPLTGPLPAGAAVEIVNSSDRPVAKKTGKIIDVVRVTGADYDADTRSLTVDATSSDATTTGGRLTVTGFGPLTDSPFTQVAAPPATITVTSSRGGSTTVPLNGSGRSFLPAAPVAGALTPGQAIIGQVVKLDGTGSTGEITSYSWKQTAGTPVTLTGADLANASFTAAQAGSYTFDLTVTGPGGASTPMSVTVEVIDAIAPTANAGPDQTAVRGRAVTLDGSASTAAETYSWRQVSGPPVTLKGATTAKPTFTYPLHALPAVPGPNAAYVYDNSPVVLALTVTNPAGSNTTQMVVRPQAETISGVTARYRNRGEWRIDATTNLLAGQRVSIVLGSNLNGRIIGVATVDAAGAISLRAATPAPGTIRTISLVSTTGGRVLGAPVTVTN